MLNDEQQAAFIRAVIHAIKYPSPVTFERAQLAPDHTDKQKYINEVSPFVVVPAQIVGIEPYNGRFKQHREEFDHIEKLCQIFLVGNSLHNAFIVGTLDENTDKLMGM